MEHFKKKKLPKYKNMRECFVRFLHKSFNVAPFFQSAVQNSIKLKQFFKISGSLVEKTPDLRPDNKRKALEVDSSTCMKN